MARLDLLLERDDVLDHHCVQRSRVEEQHPALQRTVVLRRRRPSRPARSTKNALAADCSSVRRSGEHQSSSSPQMNSTCAPAAGVHRCGQRARRYFVLDARRARLRQRRAGARSAASMRRTSGCALRPLRGNPLLVAEQPDARIECQMDDLATDELGHQFLRALAATVSSAQRTGTSSGNPASGRTAPSTAGSRSSNCGSRARCTGRSARRCAPVCAST